MWAMAVVVTSIAAKDAFEVGFVHDQKVVEALRSNGAHEPFGKGIRIRGPERGPEDLGTLRREHFVETRHILRVTIAHEELCGGVSIGEVTGDVPGLLGDPRRIGMSGHPGDPDSPATELDEDQHVEALKQHSVDTEEVRGHDAGRLGAQELSPGGTTSPGSRTEAVVLHDPGDGALRKTHAELEQLTRDAPVAPSRVLPDKGHDECGCLGVDGWTTR